MNITGYRFVELPDRDALKIALREECLRLGLKGLILLAPEGMNYFLAGSKQATDGFRHYLDGPSGAAGTLLGGRFANIPCKESLSSKAPFKRMLVKVKKEIISLGIESIKPQERTGLRLEAEELKRWLDEGKPCLVMDTRNDYEVRLGAFEQAVELKLDNFREFPAAVEALLQGEGAAAGGAGTAGPNESGNPCGGLSGDELKKLPVVTYCTGGVRCEKATTVLMDRGFEEVYQLEGGILRYFEKCGGAHWRGDCFVFDDRVAVDPNLRETDVEMCFACREPVTAAERAEPGYVFGESCPHCAAKGKTKRFHAANQRSDAKRDASLIDASGSLESNGPVDKAAKSYPETP